jgi:hypothetical protein
VSKKIKCPLCNGTKWELDELGIKGKCPCCHGKGTLSKPVQPIYQDFSTHGRAGESVRKSTEPKEEAITDTDGKMKVVTKQVERIEKLDCTETEMCGDWTIDYLLILSRKINEIIDFLNAMKGA